MSQTTLIIIAAAIALSALALAWLGRRVWVRRVRRLLVMLTGRTEALALAVRSLQGLLERLAEADDDTWEAFVGDSESDERRALADVGHRMEVLAHELAITPLPRFLHAVADDMEALAGSMRDLAGSVDDAQSTDSVLSAIHTIDLVKMAARVRAIEEEIEVHKSAHKVTDEAVYGGGLYI